MDQAALDIVTGIALPAAAILISTLVAVGLAASERKAAAAARVEERIDAAFVRALTALAILNTINLRTETVVEPLRELRVSLTLLESLSAKPDSDLLAEWFEAERQAGNTQVAESRRRLQLVPDPLRTEADVEKAVAAGGPVNTWARDFAGRLRDWHRRGASDDALRAHTASARALHAGAGEV
ncbi:hypothetical protein C5E02_11540 [Rathayibacter rathayi]|uniref:Uncharacterized protein n=1 Tax=Rathayibacter rathayi TaxID=33887 RepID=A0ABD6W8S1_RATRA|nr:hypothetical protein [Rathayibacter rathayi]AZZ49792.1 hypothetical protein C1O28_11855 [Rathayibacter rathayi]MWV76077.1 hypothetical protein [Rathayibacter rathayi NCPPB 2980 = VKM Ac-1601]PPF14338.1 hypothetical protein C5C04_06990 [Rathayibacter rathayi]PPF43069.1 hypothetical protein C5C08_14385 [Rathayibacter rathayi]PPG63621.1 hypothetical protein C5C16_15340 [Rathayibacter rathayi]